MINLKYLSKISSWRPISSLQMDLMWITMFCQKLHNTAHEWTNSNVLFLHKKLMLTWLVCCSATDYRTRSSAVAKRPCDASCLYSFYTLEWCGYSTVKKIRTYIYSFWHDPRTWKNRRFHLPQPTFLFPLEMPLWLSCNMLHGWKDNSMLAKPLAARTYLSSIVSELYDA